MVGLYVLLSPRVDITFCTHLLIECLLARAISGIIDVDASRFRSGARRLRQRRATCSLSDAYLTGDAHYHDATVQRPRRRPTPHDSHAVKWQMPVTLQNASYLRSDNKNG